MSSATVHQYNCKSFFHCEYSTELEDFVLVIRYNEDIERLGKKEVIDHLSNLLSFTCKVKSILIENCVGYDNKSFYDFTIELLAKEVFNKKTIIFI